MSFRAVSRSLRSAAITCQSCSSSSNARAAGANMLRATSTRQLSTRVSPVSTSAELSPLAMALGGASVGTVLYLATKSQRNAIALDSAPAPQRGSASDRLKPRPAPQPIRRKVEEARDEVQALDDEDSPAHASQQSAFDPETNTINWDCPCLGGMADGPCGEQFKEAFSCFVFSDSEVKGIECVDRFKAMQDCFRQYPEHYKEEIEDEERLEAESAEELEASIKKEDQNEA